jgi:hypothetical protein
MIPESPEGEDEPCPLLIPDTPLPEPSELNPTEVKEFSEAELSFSQGGPKVEEEEEEEEEQAEDGDEEYLLESDDDDFTPGSGQKCPARSIMEARYQENKRGNKREDNKKESRGVHSLSDGKWSPVSFCSPLTLLSFHFACF